MSRCRVTQQYILLPIIADPADETRCSQECSRYHETPPFGATAYHKGEWCEEFGALYDGARSQGCLSATTAAREAEAKAVERGYDICLEGPGTGFLGAELARIRGGDR